MLDLKVIFQMHSFIKGFVYAFNGLVAFFKNERNGQVQLCVAIAVMFAALWLSLSKSEWIVVLFCIAAVLSLEMVNSAIEKICDLMQPGYHPQIKIIKDISAAAVLWMSVLSAIIGVIIFLPKVTAIL